MSGYGSVAGVCLANQTLISTKLGSVSSDYNDNPFASPLSGTAWVSQHQKKTVCVCLWVLLDIIRYFQLISSIAMITCID